MSVLNTWFLRYKADTGQAVKDIEKLDKTTEKAAKNSKKQSEDTVKHQKKTKEAIKTTKEEAEKFGDSLTQLGTKGGNTLAVLRTGASSLGSIVTKLGPAGIAAAVGIGAIIAAVKIATAGIEDAKIAAGEAITLGENAFDARLAQGELIRLQNDGRRRGLSDEQTNQSAKGVYDRSSEIRAAQRQAARDPASAFNNPLIKQANLWKKAGVDVAAGMETQIRQQDVYLRGLVDRGESERALIEGTQLFGRTLADIKSVLSTTTAEAQGSALAMAKENILRKGLQKSSEELSTAENKLEAERKKTDERIRSQTVPATKEFTEALTEWQKATGPLQDMWGKFVASMIEGLTSLVKWSTDFLEKVGLAENRGNKTEREYNDSKVLDELESNMRRSFQNKYTTRGGFRAPQVARDRLEEEIKAARAAKQADLNLVNQNVDNDRIATTRYNIGAAADAMGVKPSDDVVDKVAEAIKNDPSIDTLDEIKIILQDQLDKTKESGKLQEAQTQYTRKIEANTAALINTGLEQALALWAANVGKAGGVAAGGFQGETRESYEKRMRRMQRTINPNTARQVSEARDTVGSFETQADTINKSAPSAAIDNSSAKSVTFGDIKVNVESTAQNAAGMVHDIGFGLRDELKYAVNEFSDPRVS